MPKDKNKPRGRMSSYAFFVQTCREEHKKKHPQEQVVFAEFSRKCADKWKTMGPKEKKRFEDMADKDKVRYNLAMDSYTPPGGEVGKGRKRRHKDPNAPKRALSAFFCFCNEERPAVKKVYPNHGIGDVAKELGKRWEVCPNRPKFEAIAGKDRERYEREMAIYKGTSKKPKASPKKVAPPPPPADDDDDDDADDDDDDDEDDE